MENYRTRQILEYIRKNKSCTLAELMEEFHVSSATIHRDVETLAKRDAVERVRGGIIYNDPTPERPVTAADYQERVVTNRRGKIAAAKKALTTIHEGDIIFLDSSTTVFELALLLKDQDIGHLTIITNSVAVMQQFRKLPPNWVLIGLGGNYDAQLNSFLGAATVEQLQHFNVTKAYVSAFGVDDKNVTTNHERQAGLIHVVMEAAEKSYLLVDRTKLKRTGLYRIAAKGAFQTIFSA